MRSRVMAVAAAGRVGGTQVAEELQTLVRSATPYSMLVNFSHAGQAALRGFSNAQAVLDQRPREGESLDRWMELGRVWNATANWMMTRLPNGTIEMSLDLRGIELAVDEVKPEGVSPIWQLDDSDRPPGVS